MVVVSRVRAMRRYLVPLAVCSLLILLPATVWAAWRQAVSARDKTRDVKAPDLDIVRGYLVRDGRDLTATIVLRKPIADNSIYCMEATIGNGKAGYQLCAKRADGEETFFLFEQYPDTKQVDATGSLRGRTAKISVAASRLGAESARFRFYFGAEATNGRPDIRDRLPDDNRPVAQQIKNPSAKTLVFPAR